MALQPSNDGQRPFATSTPSGHFGRWLILAAIIGNLLVIVFSILSVQNNREHAEHLAEVQTQNLAQAMEQTITFNIDKVHQSLRALTYEMERQLAASGKADLSALQRVIEQQKVLLPEATGIRIIDINGKAILGQANTKNPTANVADRSYFTQLQQAQGIKVTYSTPILSRFSSEMVIIVAHRINGPDGSFAGAVTAPISVDRIKALLSHYEVGQKGILAIRDHDLNLVLRFPDVPPNEQVEGRTTEATSALRELINRGHTISTYHTAGRFDQVMRVVSYRKLTNIPMYVLAGLAESEYLAGWRRDVGETVGFVLAFALMSIAGSWLLYRTWQRQVRDTKALRASHHALKAAHEALAERDRALASTQAASGLGIFMLKFETGCYTCSAELDQILGLQPGEEITIDKWKALLHPDDTPAVLAYFRDVVIPQRRPFNYEYRIIRPVDGSIRWLQIFGAVDCDENDKPHRMSGTILDITDRKRQEEGLRLAHEVFINTHEAVMITDEHAVLIDVNPAFTTITGYARDEAIGQSPRMLRSGQQNRQFYQELWNTLSQQGYWEGEFHNRRKDGTVYIQATKISAIRDDHDHIVRYIALASDVTEMRANQDQIEHLAYHDKLTNLPNRLLLADRLQLAIAHADQQREMLGVCYLDLDGFKAINDTWGHDVGDAVLVEAARRLGESVRAGDTVARLGGDEFVVLLSNVHQIAEIEHAIQRMLTALAQPIQTGTTTAKLTASIGVALYPDDIEDADQLIRRADQAMYTAKRTGKNQFHLFDSEEDRRLRMQYDLSNRISLALEQDEFRLHYQPKVNMLSGEIVGVEALIRWQHPDRGLLGPMEFLPATENTPLSIALGEWVIQRALHQMAEWAASGLGLPVSVNISGFHLQQPDFVERLSALLEQTPAANPKWLQLEILETTAVEDIESVSGIIDACSRFGISFAIDDFGTGYSSLTYFRRLPTHLMKIDRSFVRGMLNDTDDYALIESIVKLAQSFQRQVIAEGVETYEQGLALMKIGCYLAQGYCIARPMPPEEIAAWVGEWRIPPAWQEKAQSIQARQSDAVQLFIR
ncbi:MAG: sensory box/GGDEF/GAF/EAL domain protein [Burkholderiaceae bacterium]|nr:sensory box/GGDEF/GAF/EAL domain protein [Burkholderiaceae bacterium]